MGKPKLPNPTGERIRALRKERGFTLDRLAELTGSSKSYIWELENKAPPRPSAEKLSRVATALGVTSDYLLKGSENGTVDDAVDVAFFRRYQDLDTPTKAKLRKMIDLFEDDE